MKRALMPMFMAAALWQIGCCNCDDNPTAPVAGNPTPAPTPAPTPTPTPSATGCSLPPVSPDAVRACRSEPPPQFESIVVRAQDEVRRTHPELFDGQGKVFSAQTYSGWVASVIRSYGYCAAAVGGDGTDEVGVKTSNDWNEQYDIVTGSRDTWTNYTVTCRPALF